jgi:peptidoglycan-associated lipoprotein
MNRIFKTIVISLVVAGIGLVGCQKKVTKVEAPPPEKPPVVAPEPVAPPPIEEFKPIEDIDAQLREVLQTIYFDFDRYDLRTDAISKLEAIARFLQGHSSVRLLSEGNCDERGSSEYNMGLGENRAKAVKKYLTSYGISADRCETTSYGKERPARLNCGADDGCHEANRRVEWKVLAK